MNKKQVEALLFEYPYLKAKVKNIDIEIEKIKHEYRGIKGMSYDSIGGGGTNAINRSVENEVIKRDEKYRNLVRQRMNYMADIEKMNNALETLNENQKEIIKLRYFKRIDWCDVAVEMGYTYGWVWKHIKPAYKALGMMLS